MSYSEDQSEYWYTAGYDQAMREMHGKVIQAITIGPLEELGQRIDALFSTYGKQIQKAPDCVHSIVESDFGSNFGCCAECGKQLTRIWVAAR